MRYPFAAVASFFADTMSPEARCISLGEIANPRAWARDYDKGILPRSNLLTEPCFRTSDSRASRSIILPVEIQTSDLPYSTCSPIECCSSVPTISRSRVIASAFIVDVNIDLSPVPIGSKVTSFVATSRGCCTIRRARFQTVPRMT